MADANDDAGERAVVTTYVPEYQKQQWKHHAEDLDMSQSEFVKAMVQAGRRGFGADAQSLDSTTPFSSSESQGSDGGNGENDDLKQTVLAALDENPYLTWEELLESVIGDVETALEETITSLQENNEITHSPRRGGYVLMED
jgi:hypothetical protein